MVIIPPDLDLADYIPKRRLISNVSLDRFAIVTTTEPHGYEKGQIVRLHVVDPNPMVLMGVKAVILSVPSDMTFMTDVDTTDQFAFSAPSFPPPFTEAHCVPITGDVKNIAGPLV